MMYFEYYINELILEVDIHQFNETEKIIDFRHVISFTKSFRNIIANRKETKGNVDHILQ